MPLGRQVVDPPTSTPLPYGLLSVVQTPPTGDPHWTGGITYRSRCQSAVIVTGGATYDECLVVTGAGGAPPPPPTKADNTDTVVRGATPFTAYAKFDCSPVGNEDALAQAQAALAIAEPWQVERAFWTGLSAGRVVVWPHLAHGTVNVFDPDGILLQTVAVTGGATPLAPARALGALEQQLGDCYGGQGVVHVPAAALPVFDKYGLLRTGGGRLTTLNGNLVAAGGGYPGTSPLGAAPAAGSVWIYGTGAVFMRRGTVRVPSQVESFNRAENTIEMIAERTYVLGWDCCHAAQLVNLDG